MGVSLNQSNSKHRAETADIKQAYAKNMQVLTQTLRCSINYVRKTDSGYVTLLFDYLRLLPCATSSILLNFSK